MSRIKTIVVGAGHLGRIHTRLANSLDIFDVVGVVDPSSEARNQFQAELGIQGFESIDQVPETLEAAIVAAPTGLHYPICQSLLEQGTHVLVGSRSRLPQMRQKNWSSWPIVPELFCRLDMWKGLTRHLRS